MEVSRRPGEALVKEEFLLSANLNCDGKQKSLLDNDNTSEATNNSLKKENYPLPDSVDVESKDKIVDASSNQLHVPHINHDKENGINADEPITKNEVVDGISLKRNNENSQHENHKPKKKIKGQNKARPRTVPKQNADTKICPSILINEKCRYGEKCIFSHDVDKFMKAKPKDIGNECVNFRLSGRCRYGIECRYAKEHITEDYKNVINVEKYEKFCEKYVNDNTLKRDVMISVRKRQYKFPRSEKYLKNLKNNEDKNLNSESCDGLTDCNPRDKKVIDFSNKLYLAPLTTVGNLPFRAVCKKLGADITCGEMAMATKLLQCHQSEWALIKRHQSEDIFGVQICGAYPDTMSKVTELLNNECNIDFIDINMGCPIDLIFKKGEGSALMGRLGKLEQVMTGMKEVSNIPITIKMRTGIYENKINAHKIVPLVKEWGADLITLHGRTREQRYTKAADWDYINTCANLAHPVPLFGNGDILSYEEANLRRESTGVSGLMIARGALIKPWIFTEIKEQRHWDISSQERFELLKDFCNAGLIHWGSDLKGVESTRRFLLEWLSFLNRYIPVGLLEVLPQKINERAPRYFGRNDLETLFASDNAADWIKISEMLLGPVPDNFSFLPKHKANSYS